MNIGWPTDVDLCRDETRVLQTEGIAATKGSIIGVCQIEDVGQNNGVKNRQLQCWRPPKIRSELNHSSDSASLRLGVAHPRLFSPPPKRDICPPPRFPYSSPRWFLSSCVSLSFRCCCCTSSSSLFPLPSSPTSTSSYEYLTDSLFYAVLVLLSLEVRSLIFSSSTPSPFFSIAQSIILESSSIDSRLLKGPSNRSLSQSETTNRSIGRTILLIISTAAA